MVNGEGNRGHGGGGGGGGGEIDCFLKNNLSLQLHEQKSKIISLYRGIDFLGFRNFSRHKLLRKRSIRKMQKKIVKYSNGKIIFSEIFDSFKGWSAHAQWANTSKVRGNIKLQIVDELWKQIKSS